MILDGGNLRILWLQQAVVVGGIFVKFSPLMSFIPNGPLGKTIFLQCACSEHSCPLPQHVLHLQAAQRAAQGPSEGGRGHPPTAAPGYSSCPLLPLTFGPYPQSCRPSVCAYPRQQKLPALPQTWLDRRTWFWALLAGVLGLFWGSRKQKALPGDPDPTSFSRGLSTS